MELNKKQKQEWEEWLSEIPENIRKVAEKFVPWKKYKDKRIIEDIGNRYIPLSYQEHVDGSVTISCEKINEEISILGGYGVFGMNPDNLIEAE